MGDLVAYPVENPVGRRGSAPKESDFVNMAGRGKSASAGGFPPIFTLINGGTDVIRVGSEAPLATTRGGIA